MSTLSGVSLKFKFHIYNTIVLLVLTSASETWTTTKRKEKITTFQRNMLKKIIFSRIKSPYTLYWKIRTYLETCSKFEKPGFVAKINI